MPKPSRRLLLFCAAALLVIAAPLVIFGAVAVRAVLTPPVAGTQFFSYDGLSMNGACDNQPSSQGGQVWLCNFSFRIDSRFAVVDRESPAVGWCIQQVNEAHFNVTPPRQFGPLLVGRLPTVSPDWGNCSAMVPRRVGLYAELVLKH